jgi:predicted ABC-type sugar transport system permease subunit
MLTVAGGILIAILAIALICVAYAALYPFIWMGGQVILAVLGIKSLNRP